MRSLLLTVTLLFMAIPAACQAPRDDARYVASSRGEVYYWIDCQHRWGRLSPSNLRYFATAEAAEAAGYRPSRSAGCGRQPADRAPGEPLPAASSPRFTAGRCVVQRITDGDTVVCSGHRIRLLLIDAPETSQSDLGLRSKLALESLLPVGDTARVEMDVQERDRYGRVLAYLYNGDGVFVNRAMVRRGYAVVSVYPPNVRHVDPLRAAADSARSRRAGLWSSDGFSCLPAEHRRGNC
ncbi:MAG TPA: thermonuclease family protein [Longimicrobiales bacterium]|nr:thermonuclease family protein [Longimicrobiales bacterium]